MLVWILCLTLLGCINLSKEDTPANCLFDDIKGSWMFQEGHRNGDSSIDCKHIDEFIHKTRITLMYPNQAVDQFGNRGTWTMVYNQGFEVTVGGRSYFAFSLFEKNSTTGNVTSICDKTSNGWSRDVTVRHWSCYKASKINPVPKKSHIDPHHNYEELSKKPYVLNHDFIDHINSVQSSWTAVAYPKYEKMSLLDHLMRNGGPKSWIGSRPKASKPDGYTKIKSLVLPASWDWRNVSGENYVSPIRNQGGCGSCYAFASMAALESRVRILTKNTVKNVYSPQDVLGCSELAQGCAGGFPYLIAGRYAQDVGVVPEKCSPYEGRDDTCKTKKTCSRLYAAKYRYVGGYFGGCNEEEMKLALVRGGPLAVGFQVYDDFMLYNGGVYTHTHVNLKDKFNPLEETNHAVLVVGYGTTSDGLKYWSVKNSWGPDWGDNGYFKINRGNDECGMESMAVEVLPIP